MVRPERFELPTFWFVARRSIQLSYGRIRTWRIFFAHSLHRAGLGFVNNCERSYFIVLSIPCPFDH